MGVSSAPTLARLNRVLAEVSGGEVHVVLFVHVVIGSNAEGKLATKGEDQ